MFRVERYILALMLLLAAACTSDNIEPTTTTGEQEEARITIYGGKPTGSLTTRTVNPPSLAGICRADKIQAWVYTHSGNSYSWVTPSDLTLNETLPVLDVSNTNQTNGSVDRWVKRDYTYAFRRAFGFVNGNHFAIPALAYTQADASMFSINTGSNYTGLYLTLNNTSLPTPELFFGRLRFLTTESKLTGYWGSDDGRWDQYGYFYYRNTTTGSGTDNFTNPLSGHLYRIVSQINVNITEVPTAIVESFELWATNVPKKIVLYGTHGNIYGSDGIGRFYPVTAATAAGDCLAEALVASTNDLTDDEAHMSAFMLPSEVGSQLTLRVYYKPGALKDEFGNNVAWRNYVIHPGKSALLTGDDADVYTVATPSLQSGGDLYVYNTTANRFYSYANVRVNINGKYENVAAEEQDVDITLEVEPSYEREHTITIN